MSRKNLEPKQVIVIRKDLNMSAGKLAAQVSHASMAAFFQSTDLKKSDLGLIDGITIPMDSACDDWINGRFTKVVVYVKSEEALKNIEALAIEKGLPNALITDAGFTEFNGPTMSCLGIGPCYPDDFIGVTNKLRLFNADVVPE